MALVQTVLVAKRMLCITLRISTDLGHGHVAAQLPGASDCPSIPSITAMRQEQRKTSNGKLTNECGQNRTLLAIWIPKTM